MTREQLIQEVEELYQDTIREYESGTCIHCGSENIDYPESMQHADGETYVYPYVCLDCGNAGENIYLLEFVRNQKR